METRDYASKEYILEHQDWFYYIRRTPSPSDARIVMEVYRDPKAPDNSIDFREREVYYVPESLPADICVCPWCGVLHNNGNEHKCEINTVYPRPPVFYLPGEIPTPDPEFKDTRSWWEASRPPKGWYDEDWLDDLISWNKILNALYFSGKNFRLHQQLEPRQIARGILELIDSARCTGLGRDIPELMIEELGYTVPEKEDWD